MKKILVLALALLLSFQNAWAASYTANASPAIVTVSTTSIYANITFPATTRNLNVINGDAANAIWVDAKSATNTGQVGTCFLVPAGDTLDLYDFATDGITIIFDQRYRGGNDSASPISVIATW